MEKRKCKACGTEFDRSPRANNKQYCSVECRQRVYNDKNREKSNAYQRARWQKNVKGKKITCAICGEGHRQVGTHIVQRHGMTAREYREKYGFDVKKGQLPDDLRKLYGEQALENGTYRNLKAGAKHRFVKGQDTNYKRSEETMRRLKRLA